MYAGKLVEVGGADQIHNRPAHPYTHGLLGSFPSVHGARRELAGIPGTPPTSARCRLAARSCRAAVHATDTMS